jgi:hypothetical protein
VPSASVSASTFNPFSTNSPLNPANLDSPLNSLGNSLGDLASNLTDAVNDGLGDTINGVVEGVVKQTGIGDFYYVYLQKICSGSIVRENDSNSDAVKIDECRSYEEAGNSKCNA